MIDELGPGDVILKGANALNYEKRQAAVLVAHPEGGTILCALKAVVGRRTKLLIPVGLEKSVYGDLFDLSRKANAPAGKGPRLLPMPGEIFTEIEALNILSGVRATLSAAGGIEGGEGGVVLFGEGNDAAVEKASSIVSACGGETLE